MIFEKTKIPGCYTIHPEPKSDSRGWFLRTYCKNEFKKINFESEWLQINHSYTQKKGTIRGMHFQNEPHSEIKLIRCVNGKVFDVIVDLRSKSPTFLQWISIELNTTNHTMVLVPKGCAHGFQTLSDECELIYHHSEFYNSTYESGINYHDPIIDIKWPLLVSEISDKDKNLPFITPNFNSFPK